MNNSNAGIGKERDRSLSPYRHSATLPRSLLYEYLVGFSWQRKDHIVPPPGETHQILIVSGQENNVSGLRFDSALLEYESEFEQ